MACMATAYLPPFILLATFKLRTNIVQAIVVNEQAANIDIQPFLDQVTKCTQVQVDQAPRNYTAHGQPYLPRCAS